MTQAGEVLSSNEIHRVILHPGSETYAAEVQAAAMTITTGLAVYHNGPVFAVPGNANNPDLQASIQRAKNPPTDTSSEDLQGDQLYPAKERGAAQPVGWTVPFDDRVLSTIDLTAIEDDKIRDLLQDPDRLTALIGGLCFLRAPADMAKKKELGIPDSIIPETSGASVQIYSPIGLPITTDIIVAAQQMGAEPVMTSANITGMPEAVSLEEAEAFALYTGLPLIYSDQVHHRPTRPQGSFPIFEVRSDHFAIVRPGHLSMAMLRSLLDGYDVRLANPYKERAHPNMLYFGGLPANHQNLRGPELRLAVLDHELSTAGGAAA